MWEELIIGWIVKQRWQWNTVEAISVILMDNIYYYRYSSRNEKSIKSRKNCKQIDSIFFHRKKTFHCRMHGAATWLARGLEPLQPTDTEGVTTPCPWAAAVPLPARWRGTWGRGTSWHVALWDGGHRGIMAYDIVACGIVASRYRSAWYLLYYPVMRHCGVVSSWYSSIRHRDISMYVTSHHDKLYNTVYLKCNEEFECMNHCMDHAFKIETWGCIFKIKQLRITRYQ